MTEPQLDPVEESTLDLQDDGADSDAERPEDCPEFEMGLTASLSTFSFVGFGLFFVIFCCDRRIPRIGP
jgi:hypothetical protein